MVSFFFTADLRVALALELTLALTAFCITCYLVTLAVTFLAATLVLLAVILLVELTCF